MPEPSKRSRSKKRRRLRLPGERVKTRFQREKTGVSRCGRCGGELSGIPHLIPSKIGRLSASKRRVERRYGGHLCHDCLRDLLKQTVRSTYKP